MSDSDNTVIIAGAGLSGLSMALMAANSGIKAVIIEQANPKNFLDDKFDGRVSAITKNSKTIFENLGVWSEMEGNAQPINDIRITDLNSPVKIEYSDALVGETMGYIIENRHIRRPVFAAVKNNKNIKIIAEEKITEIDAENAIVKTSSGQEVIGKLIIAADGKNSALAKFSNIKKIAWGYSQEAIVCTIRHEKNHGGEALERFLPAGPFATLPLAGGFHSSLVWTEKKGLAEHYIKMPAKDFIYELSSRLGSHLGSIELVEPRFCYPLSISYAEKYFSGRVVLIGDAAHAIHPVAGQGFNLGLRDVEVLGGLLSGAKNLGLDIGGGSILKKYETIRRPDNFLMMAVTDNINRLFSNNSLFLKLARGLGMAAVDKIPALKKIFVLHAMGELGYKARHR